MEDELHKNGYILIKNPLADYQKNNALNCIRDVGGGKKMIDYNKFNLFIDNDFIPTINNTFGWSSIYLKYRFSNSQNSKDAATFHGDIYNFADENLMPIYTGLIYFDGAVMEIIPGSHIKNNLSTRELYNRKVKLIMGPGDILVFHANMNHRGVFHESKRKNRRLLQVFEIFPNKKVYEIYKPKFLSVITGQSFIINNVSFLSEYISKNKNADDLMSYLHFWLVNNGLQYKLVMSDISQDQKNGRYVGYLPGLIDTVKEGMLQDWNINLDVIDYDRIIPDGTIQKISLIIIIMMLIYSRYNTNTSKLISQSYKKTANNYVNKILSFSRK